MAKFSGASDVDFKVVRTSLQDFVRFVVRWLQLKIAGHTRDIFRMVFGSLIRLTASLSRCNRPVEFMFDSTSITGSRESVNFGGACSRLLVVDCPLAK